MAACLSRPGTKGYAVVYHGSAGRLAGAMLLIATAAILAAPNATQAVPERQARATVRIIRVEPIRFQEIERRQPEMLRQSLIKSQDGKSEPARLLEYQ